MTGPTGNTRHPVLGLRGPVDAGAIPTLCAQLRCILEETLTDEVTCDVALCNPDAVAIDALARLQLTARRLGGSIRLRRARRELVELLTLAGLQEVVPLVTSHEPRRSARLDISEREGSDPDERLHHDGSS